MGEVAVSIPNGKSGPLRRRARAGCCLLLTVSIPNGKSGPLRLRQQACWTVFWVSWFQSQTGSQALSDADRRRDYQHKLTFQSQTGSQALSDQSRLSAVWQFITCFNPKREVRPSQTACRMI